MVQSNSMSTPPRGDGQLCQVPVDTIQSSDRGQAVERTYQYPQPRHSRPPAASSSTSHSRILESANTSTLDDSHPFTSGSKFSPSFPSAFDTGVMRRRLSNPPVPGDSSTLRPRGKSILEHPQSPPSESRRLPPYSRQLGESSSGWFGKTLSPPQSPSKHNKSDDERELDEDGRSRGPPRPRKRRTWLGMTSREPQAHKTPIISMTPADPHPEKSLVDSSPPTYHETLTSRSSYSSLTAPSHTLLASLPVDPDHILPLSLPGTPYPSPPLSRHTTPYHTPHPSLHDLAAEYNADSGPSGSSGSPRTSMSTSSSRLGWQSATTRSDSRSSAEDDSPTYGHGRMWWWAGHEVEAPVSPKIANTAPRTLRLAYGPKLLPAGTRNWGWIINLVRRFMRAEETSGQGTSRARQRNRERDRLMAGYGRKWKSENTSGAKWFARTMAFVPKQFWSIVSRFFWM